MYNIPSISDFTSRFYRDFPFGTDLNVSVLDQDILTAQVSANMAINQDLWMDQASFNEGYNLLTAHYLVLNLRASSQGLNGQFAWLQNSKGVGQVSEGLSIPQRILDNPALAMLSRSNYGAAYLELILPQLCGQMFSICGQTKS